MRTKVMVVAGSVAVLCAALPPMASAAPSAKSGFKLVWADEFNGSRLSSSWAHRPAPAGSRVCSREAPEMISVSGGTLRLSVREDQNPPEVADGACEYGQFVSASIGTAAARTFRYGLFEARIKFASSDGGHGAFWMQPDGGSVPSPRVGDSRRDGAEIDVVEYFGDGFKGGGLRNSVHYYKRNSSGKIVGIREDTVGKKVPSKFKSRSISRDYHVFSVEWTPSEYIYRMDGKVTFRTKRGVSKVPQYLILSQITSDWEQRRAQDGPSNMTTKVDWVRVYKR